MTPPGQSNTIELRAARYFGLERYPRESFKLSRYRILIVSQGRFSLYTEEGSEPRGEAMLLTDPQLEGVQAAMRRLNR
jgi:hypothetical protein